MTNKQTKTKCNPHNWKLPEVGDEGIICINCGRFLHFYNDITPNIRSSILNSMELRKYPMGTFSEAFYKASDHITSKYGTQKIDTIFQPMGLPKRKRHY